MRTKKPEGTHRVKITATISPRAAALLEKLTCLGDGKGQVIDKALEALNREFESLL